MSSVLAVVTLGKKSGIPADATQNSFVFTTPTTPASNAELSSIGTAIASFYNDNNTTLAVYSYLSESVSTGSASHKIQHYLLDGHLNGTPHGSPVKTETWQTPFVATTALPSEVAICLSFHGAYGADVEFGTGGSRPRARHRGRIFIGPLGLNVIDEDATTHETFVTAACRTDITVAANRLRNFSTNGIQWSVWSRVRAAVEAVTGGWVDNAFDTQRRRGNDPSARTTFGALL